MIWGATGGLVIDTGRILTGDFENVGKSSFGNIKGGWDRLHDAGLNMNKTGEMYEKYKLDEAQKKQLAQNDLSKKLTASSTSAKISAIDREISLPLAWGTMQ